MSDAPFFRFMIVTRTLLRVISHAWVMIANKVARHNLTVCALAIICFYLWLMLMGLPDLNAMLAR